MVKEGMEKEIGTREWREGGRLGDLQCLLWWTMTCFGLAISSVCISYNKLKMHVLILSSVSVSLFSLLSFRCSHLFGYRSIGPLYVVVCPILNMSGSCIFQESAIDHQRLENAEKEDQVCSWHIWRVTYNWANLLWEEDCIFDGTGATVIEDEDLSWDVEEEKEEEDKDKQELKGASKAKESEITSVSDITTPILEGPEFHGSISTAPLDLSLVLMAEGR